MSAGGFGPLFLAEQEQMMDVDGDWVTWVVIGVGLAAAAYLAWETWREWRK